MSDVNELLNLYPILYSVGLAVLFGITLTIVYRPIMLLRAHWRMKCLLTKLGCRQLSHAYLQANIDDALYIEHLFLQEEGVLLVHVKPYRGNIFAAEQIESWTQVIHQHSFKFPNPLYQLELDLQYLRSLMPKIKVSGLIVFSKGSQFPKGKPENILTYEELLEKVKTIKHTSIPDRIKQAWTALVQDASAATHIKSTTILRKGDKGRLIWGSLFFACSIVYFLWMMKWVSFV